MTETPTPDNDAGTVQDVREFLGGQDWADVFATVLLALATVATAWSGYQASRWSGEQAIKFSEANAARVEAGTASTAAGQKTQIDVALFVQWIDAFAKNETELTAFYETRFREEFRPAFKAWLAMKPRTNPAAPLSPFAMPQYRVADQVEAERLNAVADAAGAQARVNNQRSDNYVLCVVLFAASLFFAGISTKLRSRGSRTGILGLGYVVFFGTILWILTFPVSFSV